MSKFSLKINKASYSERFVKYHNYKNTENVDSQSKCMYLLLTFQRNVLPASSRHQSKPGTKIIYDIHMERRWGEAM
jgi:hypothetical protein